jgi:hypothetical protein
VLLSFGFVDVDFHHFMICFKNRLDLLTDGISKKIVVLLILKFEALAI